MVSTFVCLKLPATVPATERQGETETETERELVTEERLRLRLFWVKMISGNHFHPFPHVWLQWKIQFSGNCIPVDHNFPL